MLYFNICISNRFADNIGIYKLAQVCRFTDETFLDEDVGIFLESIVHMQLDLIYHKSDVLCDDDTRERNGTNNIETLLLIT